MPMGPAGCLARPTELCLCPSADSHVPLVQLCDLYENDCIFDKFDCCVDGKGERMATGSYSNLFSVIGRDGRTPDIMLEASRDPLRKRLQTVKVRPPGNHPASGI